jgi:uncharacterized cupredoxin-like copper-binding protein
MARLLALLPAALLLAACGGGGYGGSNNAGSGSVIKTIRVSEKEYSLSPSTITVSKAGTYAFEITNNGTITHAFTIEQKGGGAKKVQAGDISPGSKKTIDYTFSSGHSYEMYCPIDGHKAMGMAGTISIGGSASGGTTNPAGQTTTTMPGY